jgi:hypothetical protein
VPLGDRPTVLVWVKRVWRCRNLACPVVTWTDSVPIAAPRAALTQRAKTWGGPAGRTARETVVFGVSEDADKWWVERRCEC